ncbi:MAG: tetratricopeptide repeat protein [Phormidium sp. BM_Day4_Bin.17]|nr:tetratricopeptide repeat protein [Phormidium sp. BM_Day4_Bin.17]UCJ10596.1 MAG: tetratricopeptide repeat protein [Phormidium sp. PBR-2020]
MSDRDRYLAVIDKILESTLAGRVRSVEQVYQRLLREIRPGTSEIFERCLLERRESLEGSAGSSSKVTRKLRALQTVEGQYQRWEQEHQTTAAVSSTLKTLVGSPPEERLALLVGVLDPNQERPWSGDRLKQLAQALQRQEESHLQQLGLGLRDGLARFAELEGDLVGWIYEGGNRSIGFGEAQQQPGPWPLWARKTEAYFPRELFLTLQQGGSLGELAQRHLDLGDRAWLELAVLLQGLQRGLVLWFDRQPYSAKMGKQLSVSTFLVFASIWGQLSQGFMARERLTECCFQMTLQILRSFAQRETFPLYGGVFASLSGEYLQQTLAYLEVPLKRVEGTQEKARILTLLGYSQRALGDYERAEAFHEEALEIAQQAGDRPCELANYNHLSRLCLSRKQYSEAIDRSQRALILSRQVGDRLGVANALVNLGYSEVLAAQQVERLDEDLSERALGYLEQGLELSQQLGDRQSLALCYYSLGLAYVLLEKPSRAVGYLLKGVEAAQSSGDLYLQGLSLAALAEGYYQLQDWLRAVTMGAIAAYSLQQIEAQEWRQAAGVLSILRGQLGEAEYEGLLSQGRSQIIAVIGVDGYDYLPQLLQEF